MPVQAAFALLALIATPLAAQVGGDQPISLDAAKKLKNPIPYSRASLTQGRGIFLRMCASCHGNDGKAAIDVVADATDLTDPKSWRNGTTDGEIYRSTRDGQGQSMPAFRTQIKKDDDLWHLVNFIRSLWPEATRPALVPDANPEEKK